MFKREFPFTKTNAYFNTAYVGLMPKSLIKYRARFDSEFSNAVDKYKTKSEKLLISTRTVVSKLVGSDFERTHFTSGFSAGIRYALDCIDPNSKVLVLEEDYPSLLYAVKERDFQITQLPITYDIENQISNCLSKQKIDVLVLSVVQYISGLQIDLDFLKNIKRKYPNLLILGDATQFIGAEAFRMNQSAFDVVAFSTYKWLMSGFGNGILCLSKNFIDKTHTDLEELEEKIYRGHLNLSAVSSLKFMAEKILDWNIEYLVEQKNSVSQYLKTRISELGLTDEIVQKRTIHSSIFNLKLDGIFQKKLESNRIQTIQRGNGIRVSVHFYNTRKDIDRLIGKIQTARLTD